MVDTVTPAPDREVDVTATDPGAVAPVVPPAGRASVPEHGFRRDIEGLRAVAVALVVLYHAHVPSLAGGYVGVDVFFVVSGFLITGLLVGELRERGGYSLRAFYARRLRRLLPASVLVLVVTVAMVKLLLPPLAAVGFRSDAAATATYLANVWHAIEDTSYLADPAPSPVLHYWSLAVEEQFYLVWPLLLLGVARVRRGALRTRLLVAVGAVLGASLALSLVLTPSNQPFAFFLLPTRAWELAAGGLLALTVDRWRRVPAGVAAGLAWAGVGGILLAALTFDERTLFPGWAALLPVAATAAVIAGGTAMPALGPERVLSLRPFLVTGRLSYSLYLWHWPLLVIPATARGGELDAWERTGLVLLSVVLAALTYALVEDRLRNLPSLVRSHARSFGLGAALTGVALVAAFVGGVLPALDAGRPAAAAEGGAIDYVPSDLRPSLRGAFDDLPEIWTNGCHANLVVTAVNPCVYGDPAGDRTVVLLGDSHAAHWFPAFERAATAEGWRLVSLTKSACPAASVDLWVSELGRAYTECDEWRRDALAAIGEETMPVVVLTGSHHSELDQPGDDPAAVWASGYEATIAALPEDASVVVLGDTPQATTSVPVCLSDHLTDIDACALGEGETTSPAHAAAEQDVAERLGARWIDPTPWVCESFPCPVIRGDLLVYRDGHHLTTPFAASLAPQLVDALSG